MQLNVLKVTSQIATSAVPKGSILGPLLYNIFLNDIFSFLRDANLGNYADDSTLYANNKNLIYNLRHEFSILSNITKWR